MKQLFAFILAVLCSATQAQTCTTTLNSPGAAAIESAVSSAAAGDVICLANGNWGNPTITSQKSGRVTVKSQTGRGATVNPTVYNSSNLEFRSLTLSGFWYANPSTPHNSNITIADNVMSAGNITVDVSGSGTNENLLIYGNTFAHAYNPASEVGNVHVTATFLTSSGLKGIVIAHNTFDGTGACSDGIQMTGGVNGITIGPGNVFKNWNQASGPGGSECGPHVDAIQIVDAADVTIIGNYSENNYVHIGIYDGTSNLVIQDNIFRNQISSSYHTFQIGGTAAATFIHNTIYNIVLAAVGSKPGQVNSNWTIKNNLLVNSNWLSLSDGCGSPCAVSYNQRDSSSTIPTGTTNTNNTVATPTFVNGAPSLGSSNWANYKLANGSPGKNAGDDGKDLGTRYYKRGPVTGVN